METKEIRKKFLDFFKKKEHIILPGSSLIINDDPSLLFTNSGMVQFKNIFSGKEETKYTKVTTSQICIRVGGKHNDLENIGKSTSHNTSFEMLGNFSFSNYFKKDAIHYAWEFLTEEIKIEKENLYISIHKNDCEVKDIWINQIKINENKIIYGDDSSNFWMMGDTGPCGFCTEIFYKKNDNELLEIWNLVFIQYYADENKELKKLNKFSIDTGMGLERVASIKQNVFDIFKIDIFKELYNATKNILNTEIYNINIKIIIDHIKTYIFIANEGIVTSNEGRGYILKKLIRKAIINKNIDFKNKKLYKLIPKYIEILNKYYDNIISKHKIIEEIIKYEEKKFEKTLKFGISYINKIIKNKNITANDVFILYDTYGIPIEVINEIIKKNNLEYDVKAFIDKMNEQKIKSIPKKKKEKSLILNYIHELKKTTFVGYKKLKIKTKIIKIISVDIINKIYLIILDKTPFFATKGGQKSDIGIIENNNTKFKITKIFEIDSIIIHKAYLVNGIIEENIQVVAKVNKKYRYEIKNNHTCTHLLHAALKSILGDHVKQAGSLLNNKYLRFDFIHFTPVSEKEISKIEKKINNNIHKALKTKTMILNIDNAKQKLNINNINEKYKEKIRIIKIGKNISKELCAGTHVKNTKSIRLFKIIKETGIGNNIRRIEAVTGKYAFKYIKKNEVLLKNIKKTLNVQNKNIKDVLNNILKENRNYRKENEQLKTNIVKNYINNQKAITFQNNMKLVTLNINKNLNKFIKNTINEFKNTIIVAYDNNNENTSFSISITNDIKNKINILEIINFISKKINCKGGGNIFFVNGIIYDNKNTENFLNQIFSYINEIK